MTILGVHWVSCMNENGGKSQYLVKEKNKKYGNCDFDFHESRL